MQADVTRTADGSTPVAIGVRGRPAASRRWPTPVIAAVAAVAAFFRVPSVMRDTLYAEDGPLFVGEWVVHGRLSLLWEPYAGYQHLVPRLLSGAVVGVLPPQWWGYATTVLACLVVGVVAAAVFALTAPYLAYWPSRAVLGLLVVLTPLAGTEPLGNLANLHWFLLFCTPFLILATPRTRWGLVAATAAMVAVTMTEPQTVLFAPLVVWRFVNHPRTRPVLIAWILGVGVQGVTYLSAPRESHPGRPPILSVIDGYVVDSGVAVLTSRSGFAGRLVVDVGWWVGYIWVAALFVITVVGVVLGSRTVRVLQLSLLVGSVAAWSLAFVVNNNPDYYFSELTLDQLRAMPMVRWGTAASMMLAATIPVTVSALVGRRPKWWPVGTVVLGLLMTALVLDFQHRMVPSSPTWSDQVDARVDACPADGTVQIFTVPTSPVQWVVGVPCTFVA